MLRQTQAPEPPGFPVVNVAKRAHHIVELKPVSYVTLVIRGFTLTVLTYPILFVMYLADVIYPGSVISVVLPTSHLVFCDAFNLSGEVSDSSTNTSHSSHSSTSSTPGSPLAKSSPTKQSTGNKTKINSLRTLEINFQSIYSKRQEFACVVDATKPDVIFGCETWLKPSMSYGEIFPPGYDLYRKDRRDGYGGVLLAVRNNLNSHQLTIDTDAEYIAAKIISGKTTTIVGAMYRPTNNDQHYMDCLNKAIIETCQKNPGASIWLGGDTNHPDIDWESNQVVRHQYPRALNESFLQAIADAGLEQLVNFPTRGDRTLDGILTNRPTLTIRCEGLPALSDHDLVFTEVNIQAHRRKPIRHKISLWKKAAWIPSKKESRNGLVNLLLRILSTPRLNNLLMIYNKNLRKFYLTMSLLNLAPLVLDNPGSTQRPREL